MRSERRPEPGDQWTGLLSDRAADEVEECVLGKAPLTYGPGAILTTQQVADWLQVSTRQVIALRLPRLSGLGRVARYEAGMVLEHLTGKWERVDPPVSRKAPAVE
jgi:hypothetical protein